MATWARLDTFKTIIDISMKLLNKSELVAANLSSSALKSSAFVKDQTHIWIVQNYKLEFFLFVVLALQTMETVSIACSH